MQKPVRTGSQTKQGQWKMIPFLPGPCSACSYSALAICCLCTDTRSELPQPEARNVQSGRMPFPAESQPLYLPPAKVGNKTQDLSQFLRCGLSLPPPAPQHLPCEIISGPGRPTCRSLGVGRIQIQSFTFNMDIHKRCPSPKKPRKHVALGYPTA